MPTQARSRLFYPACIAAGISLVLTVVSMWVALGRVQAFGRRHAAVVADGGRIGIAITHADTLITSQWIANAYPFRFNPWFGVEKSPQAGYLSVPLWAPMIGFGLLAWRKRARGHAAGSCPECGYSQSGIDGACPECGAIGPA